MAIPTTNAAQELPAVNEILASVGQAPVTTLDQTNPDVAIAYDTLINVSREVQSEGWTFNKEYSYKLSPQATTEEIAIPNNILQIELSENQGRTKEAVRRSGKLYERVNHTYKWGTAELEFDIVWYLDWIDLPRPIQDYIVARASSIVSSRIVGDPGQYQMIQQREAYTRAMALEYECNQGNYSYFGPPHGQNFHKPYKPYRGLNR